MEFRKFFKKHWLIIIIWALGLFLRFYRQSDLLGFYYDQGRDALMASDIIHFRNFPAIGPTTGIQGLYLGPLWFYLIVPGYFIGRGNPAIASLFISLLESFTIPLIYFLISKYWKKSAAILAAFLWAGSNYLIRSSRWFSNPSPLPFIALLIMLCLMEFSNGNKKFLPWVFFLLGIGLQLEAASAIFFIPVIFVFLLLNITQTKKLPLLTWLKSAILFSILLLPQLAFEFKNHFLITTNFIGFLTGRVNTTTGKSWSIPTLIFLKDRILMYYNSFFSKLDTNVTSLSLILLFILLIGLIFILKNHLKNNFVRLILLWLFLPLTFLLFFSGNYGHLYDYYLTGFFPAFVILISLAATSFSLQFLSFISVFLIIFIFIKGNFIYVRDYLSAGFDGPEHITLGNQLLSVKYICQNSSTKYNLNIYVPPITPYTYNYLLNWLDSRGQCSLPQQNSEKVLYTLYEVDPPHPERLQSWLQDQDKSSQVINQIKFGGVVVQQRKRN